MLRRYVVLVMGSDSTAARLVFFGCCLGFMSVIHFAGRPIYLHYVENMQRMEGSVKMRKHAPIRIELESK